MVCVWASVRRGWPLVMMVCVLLGVTAVAAQMEPESRAAETESLLCRFGVNETTGNVSKFDTASLRVGWYSNYQAYANAAKPNGMLYAPTIRLAQVGEDDYTYEPNGEALLAAIESHPGADWLIGNEPDRPELQDDMMPHVYARAYHDLYELIKDVDPTARILAGTIVQPTAVRLMYLDMILESYQEQYGRKMPVDGWSVHNFIINEVDCDYDPGNCWGAEIPPGVDMPYGEVLTVDDNDRMDLFVERIENFRQWMAERGYQQTPLLVTEFGILMAPDLGFPAERVNQFMNESFEYLMNAADPEIGYPSDNYRLVQQWSWYSTYRFWFNGWLFNRDYTISVMGENFAAYTADIEGETDFYPVNLTVEQNVLASFTNPISVTLKARIANGGNLQLPEEAEVRFYNGIPGQSGRQIGETEVIALPGCGYFAEVSTTLEEVLPGSYPVYVSVTPHSLESRVNNNVYGSQVVVAAEQTFLPLMMRP